MAWKPEQLKNHPKYNQLCGLPDVTAKRQEPVRAAVVSDEPEEAEIYFTVIGDPMGAPRMNRSDAWKKRPVVARYHEFCDRIREAAPNGTSVLDAFAIDIVGHVAMPASWSSKKRSALHGKMHRVPFDWDNLGKGVCDALYKKDSMIADGRSRKFWCFEGEQRTEIRIRYFSKPVLT